jgi:hypothetical protein
MEPRTELVELAKTLGRTTRYSVPSWVLVLRDIEMQGYRVIRSEAEAGALDVERLAKALHADAESLESDPTDWRDCPEKEGHREFAQFLADEYQRLRENR